MPRSSFPPALLSANQAEESSPGASSSLNPPTILILAGRLISREVFKSPLPVVGSQEIDLDTAFDIDLTSIVSCALVFNMLSFQMIVIVNLAREVHKLFR